MKTIETGMLYVDKGKDIMAWETRCSMKQRQGIMTSSNNPNKNIRREGLSYLDSYLKAICYAIVSTYSSSA